MLQLSSLSMRSTWDRNMRRQQQRVNPILSRSLPMSSPQPMSLMAWLNSSHLCAITFPQLKHLTGMIIFHQLLPIIIALLISLQILQIPYLLPNPQCIPSGIPIPGLGSYKFQIDWRLVDTKVSIKAGIDPYDQLSSFPAIISYSRMRNNLACDLMGVQRDKKTPQKLDYHKILTLQQATIEKLRRENQKLWQYILYISDIDALSTLASDSNQMDSSQTTASEGEADKVRGIKEDRKINSLLTILKGVMQIVKAEKTSEIIKKLQELREQANKKSQPIFIQRIKEKHVPITVIREVEVPVYVDRPDRQPALNLEDTRTQSQQWECENGYKKSQGYYSPRHGRGKYQQRGSNNWRSPGSQRYRQKS